MNNFIPYPAYLNERYLQYLSGKLVSVLLPEADYNAIVVCVRKHEVKELKVELHFLYPGNKQTLLFDAIYQIHIDSELNLVRWGEELYRPDIGGIISED